MEQVSASVVKSPANDARQKRGREAGTQCAKLLRRSLLTQETVRGCPMPKRDDPPLTRGDAAATCSTNRWPRAKGPLRPACATPPDKSALVRQTSRPKARVPSLVTGGEDESGDRVRSGASPILSQFGRAAITKSSRAAAALTTQPAEVVRPSRVAQGTRYLDPPAANAAPSCSGRVRAKNESEARVLTWELWRRGRGW